MTDLLHLIRLLRQALACLGESTNQSERDFVIRQLIAELQASLVHEEEQSTVPQPRIEDSVPWLATSGSLQARTALLH